MTKSSSARKPRHKLLNRAIATADRQVAKRNGTLVPFDLGKIVRAVALAFHEHITEGGPNPLRDSVSDRHGLGETDFNEVLKIARAAERTLDLYYHEGKNPTIEQVQDSVEKAIAAAGHWEAALLFMRYRARRAERRLTPYAQSGMSDYVAMSKYARYRPELGRREVWAESVDRVRAMHLEFFKDKLGHWAAPISPEVKALAGDRWKYLDDVTAGRSLGEVIDSAFTYVNEKRVLPSMRSMQFAGPAILGNNARMFNCSFSNIDRIEFFREYFFLLLSGCGVGFSVRKHHVEKLPALAPRAGKLRVVHHTVADTIEGWADAIDALVKSYVGGHHVEFNYSQIRAEGAPLKTSGGKAPGHLPLKEALAKAEQVLEQAHSRKLRPIEAYDICMHIARAVLSGGIRRSATICLFSPDDEEMMNAKTGDWHTTNPQRAGSNNSAAISRAEDNREVFKKLFHAQKEFGEPGFFFCDNPDAGTNPCVPADVWVMTDKGPKQVQDLIGQTFTALVDGKPHASTAGGFFCTGEKPLLEVNTIEGPSLRLTGNHRVLVQTGITVHRNPEDYDGTRIKKRVTEWIEAKDLKPGDRMVLHHHNEVKWDGFGSRAEGWLVGSLLGDGNLDEAHATANLDYWGATRHAQLQHALGQLKIAFGETCKSAGGDQPEYDRCRTSSRQLRELAFRFGLTYERKQLNELIERTSSEFTEGFLQGWFDADGGVQGVHEKGNSVRLSSVDLNNLKVAQRMLLRLGIYATLYPDRRADLTPHLLPDGKGGKALYDVQQYHELCISGEDLRRFQQRVGFCDPVKASGLAGRLSDYKRRLTRTEFTATVSTVRASGTERVYDCTVPGPAAFDANGMYVHNCAEIGLDPVWREFYQPDQSGFQMCNLTSINGAKATTEEAFYQACVQAAIIGTLQAAYTDIKYLGDVTRRINDRDALLGVSICGFMDNPDVLLNPEVLTNGAKLARATNQWMASRIGINPAARVTCVKPEGTASLVLGAASGIHPHHAQFYFRRVTANRLEPVFQFFRDRNSQMIEVSYYNPDRDDKIVFPVVAPKGAICRKDLGAIQFLDIVKTVQQAWVLHGTANPAANLNHNVSNTCTVKADEWNVVEDYIWKNRGFFTGISLLAWEGDKRYPQAPNEEPTTESDVIRWNELKPGRVDYTEMREATDETKLAEQAACASGVCALA
jgi:ribonucleotide reductase, class II